MDQKEKNIFACALVPLETPYKILTHTLKGVQFIKKWKFNSF